MSQSETSAAASADGNFPSRRGRFWSLLIPVLLLPWLGCGTTGRDRVERAPSSPEGHPIHELNLLNQPVAVDLDGIPGPDGFAVQLYAGSRAQPKAVPIRAGTVTFRMYDGLVNDWRDVESLRQWSFTAEELKQYEAITSIGVGYRLALAWGEQRPTRNRVTLVALYEVPGQPAIHSAPSAISVAGN